jgi:hypothetical protein
VSRAEELCPYVGPNVALVDELAQQTLAVGEKQTPNRLLTIVSADPGSGKTRLLQEVYESLVRAQPGGHRFWPAGLAPTLPANWHDLLLGSDRAITQRKRLAPKQIADPTQPPPFLWLGMSCQKSPDQEMLAVLDGLHTQLTALRAIKERHDAPASTAGQVVRDVAFDLAELAVEYGPVTSRLAFAVKASASVRDGTRRIAALRRAGPGQSAESLSFESELARDLQQLLAQLPERYRNRGLTAPPLVLALDDAHELGEPAARFLAETLVEAQHEAADFPLAVVATVWPDREWSPGFRQLVDALRDHDEPFDERHIGFDDPPPDQLLPLRPEDARHLLDAWAPEPLPEPVAELLVERVDASPEPGCSPLLLLDYLQDAARVRRRGLADLDTSWVRTLPTVVAEAARTRFGKLADEHPSAAVAVGLLVELGVPMPTTAMDGLLDDLRGETADDELAEDVTDRELLRDLYRLVDGDRHDVWLADERVRAAASEHLGRLNPDERAQAQSFLSDRLREALLARLHGTAFTPANDDLLTQEQLEWWRAPLAAAPSVAGSDWVDRWVRLPEADERDRDDWFREFVTAAGRDPSWLLMGLGLTTRFLADGDDRARDVLGELLSTMLDPESGRDLVATQVAVLIAGFAVRRRSLGVPLRQQASEVLVAAAGATHVGLVLLLEGPDDVGELLVTSWPSLTKLAAGSGDAGRCAALLLARHHREHEADRVWEALREHVSHVEAALALAELLEDPQEDRADVVLRALRKHREEVPDAAVRLAELHAARGEDLPTGVEHCLRRHAKWSVEAAEQLAQLTTRVDGEIVDRLWRHRYQARGPELVRAMVRLAPEGPKLKRAEAFVLDQGFEDPLTAAWGLIRYPNRDTCHELCDALAAHVRAGHRDGDRGELDVAFDLLAAHSDRPFAAIGMDIVARGSEQLERARNAMRTHIATSIDVAARWAEQQQESRQPETFRKYRYVLDLAKHFLDRPERSDYEQVQAASIIFEQLNERPPGDRQDLETVITGVRHKAERRLRAAVDDAAPSVRAAAALSLLRCRRGGELEYRRVSTHLSEDPAALRVLHQRAGDISWSKQDPWRKLTLIASGDPAVALDLHEYAQGQCSRREAEEAARILATHATYDQAAARALLDDEDHGDAAREALREHAYGSADAAVTLVERRRAQGAEIDDGLLLVLERHAVSDPRAAQVLGEVTDPEGGRALAVRRLCERHVTAGAVLPAEQLLRLSRTPAQQVAACVTISRLVDGASVERAHADPQAARRRARLAQAAEHGRPLAFLAPFLYSQRDETRREEAWEALLDATLRQEHVAMWVLQEGRHRLKHLLPVNRLTELRNRAQQRVKHLAQDSVVASVFLAGAATTDQRRRHALETTLHHAERHLDNAICAVDLATALDRDDELRQALEALEGWTRKGDQRSRAARALLERTGNGLDLRPDQREALIEEMEQGSREGDALARVLWVELGRPDERALIRHALDAPAMDAVTAAEARERLTALTERDDLATAVLQAELRPTSEVTNRACERLAADLHSWERATLLGRLAITGDQRARAREALVRLAERHAEAAIAYSELVTRFDHRELAFELLGRWEEHEGAVIARVQTATTDVQRATALSALNRLAKTPAVVELLLRENAGLTDVHDARMLRDQSPRLAVALATHPRASDADRDALADIIEQDPSTARLALAEQVEFDRSPRLRAALRDVVRAQPKLASAFLPLAARADLDTADAIGRELAGADPAVALAWFRLLPPDHPSRVPAFRKARHHGDGSAPHAAELLRSIDDDATLQVRALRWLLHAHARSEAHRVGVYPLRQRLFERLVADRLEQSPDEQPPALEKLALAVLAEGHVDRARVRDLLPPVTSASPTDLVALAFVTTAGAQRRSLLSRLYELPERALSHVEVEVLRHGARRRLELPAAVFGHAALARPDHHAEAIQHLEPLARRDELCAVALVRLATRHDVSANRRDRAYRALRRQVERGRAFGALHLAEFAAASPASRHRNDATALFRSWADAKGPRRPIGREALDILERAETSPADATATAPAPRDARKAKPRWPMTRKSPATTSSHAPRVPHATRPSPGPGRDDERPDQDAAPPSPAPRPAREDQARRPHRPRRRLRSRPVMVGTLLVAVVLVGREGFEELWPFQDATDDADRVIAAGVPAPEGDCWLIPTDQTDDELRSAGFKAGQGEHGTVAVSRDSESSLADAQRLGIAADEILEGPCEQKLDAVMEPPGEDGHTWAVTDAQELNLRTGPGTAYPVVTTVGAGAPLPSTGRTAEIDSTVWRELRLDDGSTVWASGRYLTE